MLAAGYGTRMRPLTLKRPKGLVPAGGRPILARLADSLEVLPELDGFHLITNARHAPRYRRWVRAHQAGYPFPIGVLDDGTDSDDDRLGAVGDLALYLRRVRPATDLLVAADDGVYPFDLRALMAVLRSRPDAACAVVVSPEADRGRLQRGGVAVLTDRGLRSGSEAMANGDAGRVARVLEKPAEPPSDLLVAPLHLYRADVLGQVPDYLERGGERDAPGHFLQWLAARRPVYAYMSRRGWHDAGTIRAYRRTQRALARW